MYATEVLNLGSARATEGSAFGNVALVVFLLAQACDGVLTYIGVRTFGPGIEGNPMVAWLMGTLGNGAGLAAAKVTASVFGIALHLSAVHRAVAILAGFYVVVAILPWITVLYVLNR